MFITNYSKYLLLKKKQTNKCKVKCSHNIYSLLYMQRSCPVLSSWLSPWGQNKVFLSLPGEVKIRILKYFSSSIANTTVLYSVMIHCSFHTHTKKIGIFFLHNSLFSVSQVTKTRQRHTLTLNWYFTWAQMIMCFLKLRKRYLTSF